MKSRSLILAVTVLLCSAVTVFAQTQEALVIDSLVDVGNAFHDDQKYAEAISVYEKALKIDKKNPRTNYEMANTLIAVGRFEEAIKYADKVLKNGDIYGYQAYSVKASAYDYMNEPEKAIKIYKEGIEKYPADHMLPFNLAVTLLKKSEYQQAEMYAEKAVLAKKTHPGSNLMLGYANYYQDHKTETLLALYHFLLFENDSKRAKTAWSIIESVLKIGVKKENDTNFQLTVNENAHFQGVDLALMLTQTLPDSISGDNASAKLAFVNKHFFEVLKPSEKIKGPSAYNDIYVPFFSDLHKAGFTEVFSYYISLAAEKPETEAWIKENSGKLDAFAEWANEQVKQK